MSISDNIFIVYRKNFEESSANNIARERYLNLNFTYRIYGDIVEFLSTESNHRLDECDSPSLREFVEQNEPITLDALIDPQEAEIQREMITDAIDSLVRDCAGVVSTLDVDVLVDIHTNEEDYDLMELDDKEFLHGRRMSLLQKNVYIGVGTTEKENCMICLDEFEEEEEVVYTPCVHMFHDVCIGKWFERSGLCPFLAFDEAKFPLKD